MNKWIWILLAAFPLVGCQLGIDKEDDGELDTIVVSSTDDTSVTIDEEEQVNVSITGTGNNITIRGDVSEIYVKAGGNSIIIEEDTLIDRLTISSDSNDVSVAGNLETVITTLVITGKSNLVTVYDVTTQSVVENPSEPNTVTATAP